MKKGVLNSFIHVERAKIRMTQADLAEVVGCSKQHIMFIETGKVNPGVVLALKMASFFDCSVSDLFKLVDDEKINKSSFPLNSVDTVEIKLDNSKTKN